VSRVGLRGQHRFHPGTDVYLAVRVGASLGGRADPLATQIRQEAHRLQDVGRPHCCDSGPLERRNWDIRFINTNSEGDIDVQELAPIFSYAERSSNLILPRKQADLHYREGDKYF
jgi:hypothetical protein